MSAASVRPLYPSAPAPAEVVAPKLDRLALLYEGILTAAVRVQTGRQQVQDPEDFRTRMKQALREIASTAARKGYRRRCSCRHRCNAPGSCTPRPPVALHRWTPLLRY